MMGVPKEDWEEMFTLANLAFGADDADERSYAHMDIIRYFAGLLEARTKCPASDLVSALATARIADKNLTTDEILVNCDSLIVAGTETTRLAAAGGMLAFLQHPAEWRAIAEEPTLLPSAIEEVLRWTSTATHLMRTATRPVILRDRHIEAGERVTLWTPSANRDEAVFVDPDQFNIRRQPNRHLSLGAGEHFCLGAALAKAELRILYEELLRSTEHIELDGPPVLLGSIVVNGLQQLPVKMSPARHLQLSDQFNPNGEAPLAGAALPGPAASCDQACRWGNSESYLTATIAPAPCNLAAR
jgi:cytochrome P450